MPEIDIKRVLDKIRVIEDSLSKLKTLAHPSIDEFISGFKYLIPQNTILKLLSRL